MQHKDFQHGMDFTMSGARWRVTDIGHHSICAIKLDKDDASWYNGPPYAVAESVLCRYDFPACSDPSMPMAVDIEFVLDTMVVTLDDGRKISVPIAWSKRLAAATWEQRFAVEFSTSGMHWEEIDEDLSIAGLLREGFRSIPAEPADIGPSLREAQRRSNPAFPSAAHPTGPSLDCRVGCASSQGRGSAVSLGGWRWRDNLYFPAPSLRGAAH